MFDGPGRVAGCDRNLRRGGDDVQLAGFALQDGAGFGGLDRQLALETQVDVVSAGSLDVVYDHVGGELAEPALRTLAPGGRHLVVGFASGTIPRVAWNLALLKQCSIVGVAWGAWSLMNPRANQANVEALFELHAAGKLAPRITARYGLDEVPAALKAMESRAIMGKVIVVP